MVVSHDNYFHPRYSIRPDGTLIGEEDPKEYLYTMPYDSIARYDVGLRPVDRWPGQAKMAVCKPLASDLIDFTEGYAKKPVGYNIEIKSWPGEGEGTLWPDYKTFCDTCIPLLLSKHLGDRLIVQSFDTRALEYMHEKWPALTLSFLTEPTTAENIEKLLGTWTSSRAGGARSPARSRRRTWPGVMSAASASSPGPWMTRPKCGAW